MTGRTVRIMCSGFVPEARKPSQTLRRLEIFLLVCLERVASICSSSSALSCSRSMRARIRWTPAAPIWASNASLYWAEKERYSSSVSTWLGLSGVSPGSTTR